MKHGNPIYKTRLHIPRKARVLEVGSGHNPTFRAGVLVEKYLESNYHRGADAKIYPHQHMVQADGERLPFRDREFDYVICTQVLEHVDDPEAFVRELQRVAPAGYLEVPSLVGEALCPKQAHKWVCLEIDDKLVLFEKACLPGFFPDFGHMFINFLPYESLGLRLFYLSCHQANAVRYEWKESVELLVNPQDEYYRSFFTKPWSDEMCRTIFPTRSKKQEITALYKALHCLVCDKLHRMMHPRTPISLQEYKKRKGGINR